MRKIQFILALLLCLPMQAQYFPFDVAKLNKAYEDLLAKPNSKAHQQAYLEAFPDTWEQFYMTYRYDNSPNYNLSMYNKAAEHIEALKDKLTLLPDSALCEKLINVSIKGWAEADAPSYLSSAVSQVMKMKPDAMFRHLAKLRKGHQMQFWQFYWSNIALSKTIENEFDALYKYSQQKYPTQAPIMKIAFDYFYNGVNYPGSYLNKD